MSPSSLEPVLLLLHSMGLVMTRTLLSILHLAAEVQLQQEATCHAKPWRAG